MKKKILFVVSEDWYFRSHRLDLAKEALRQNFQVALLSKFSKYKKEIKRAGIEVYDWEIKRNSFNPIKEFRSIINVYKILKNYNPDLIHAVAFKPIIYSYLSGRLFGIKKYIFALGGLGAIFSVNSLKNKLLKVFLIPFLRASFRFQKMRLILQNENDLNMLIEKKIISKDKVVLIRGAGVDTAKFSPKQSIKPEQPVVIFAGRLIWTKGIKDFVECAKRIQIRTNAVFALVGKPDNSNPDAVPLEDLEKWQKKGIIEWWGHQEDMVSVLRKSSIFCFPSLYGEGLPKILIEAASTGLPIITYDVPGCRDVVSNNSNGFLVSPGNIKDLEESVMRLIENRDLALKMGLNGRKKVIESFSSEKICGQTINEWNKVLKHDF